MRSLSLVVASFTLSHVMAIVLKADTADDVNLLSMSWEHASNGGSLQHIPAKIGCIVELNGKKLVGFSMAASHQGVVVGLGLWSDMRQHQGPCDIHQGCVSFGICITESSPLGCGSCYWRSPRGTSH